MGRASSLDVIQSSLPKASRSPTAQAAGGYSDIYWDSVARNLVRLARTTLILCVTVASAQQTGPPTDALVRQGLISLQSRDIPKAQEFLERAIDQTPGDARAWIGLAQVYRMLNLHARASRHASEAARLGADDPLIQHALSMFYADHGDPAEAARWEEKFAQGERGDHDAYLRAVTLYLQADMPLRAAEVAEAALATETGKSALIHNALGKAYTTSGRAEDGLRHLKLAVETEPYQESLHFDLGYFHLVQGDFDAAQDAFLAGRRYFDKSPAIEIGLGIVAYQRKRFDVAIDRFLRATELAPGMEQPHAFLGRLLQHTTERMDDVEERMRIFHEQHSKNHFGPFLYGQVLLARLGTGRDPESLSGIEALLRESIELKDDFWESHYELGVVLERKREFRLAEEHYEKAAALNPNASKPHYRLARIYQRLGKAKEAKRQRELHKRIAEQERQAMKLGRLPEEVAGSLGSTAR